MSAHLRFMLGAAVLVSLAGCWQKQAPPAPVPAKPVTATKASTEAAKPKAKVASDDAESKAESKKDDAESDVVKASPVATVTPTADGDSATAAPVAGTPEAATPSESKPEEPAAPERIAILTPGGPLLVDVRFTIGGTPHTRAYEEAVKRVLEVGDSDHDGRSTWKELVADREYFEKQMKNAPAADSPRLKTLIKQYDENGDGQIQRSEAARWLGRDSGVSAKPFSVRSTRSYRPVPRATSQVWHLIDADADGQLTREEIAQASSRLLSLDADDDRVLAPAEMASLREQLEAAGQRRMYGGGGSSHYAVIHLEADAELDRLHYLLSDLYAPQQDLTAASFPELKSLFEKLDTSEDEWLSSDELAGLRTAEPHLEMSVTFGEAGKDNSAEAALEAKSLTPDVELSMQPTGDRAIISLGGTRLIVSAHNLATKTDEGGAYQSGMPDQIRLMVHDQCDALFEELDANADGRLGEREIAYCSERLAARDTDGDGQLAGDEFPYSMIVAFLFGERAAERSFYIPPSSPVSRVASDKPVPGWFSHADLNGDGDVSRREFLGAPAQFDRLDGDKDGYLSVTESTL